MIVKTTEEIRKYLPVVASYQFETIEPFLARAEKEFLVESLSSSLYNALNNGYNEIGGSTMTERLNNLLPYAQAAVVNYAFNIFVPVGNISISEKGILMHQEQNLKPAPLWAKEELQNTLKDAAFFDLEALLLFLDENQNDYPEWVDSSSYTKNKSLFIQYAKEFSDHFNIANSYRTFVRLKAIMKDVQEDKISELLGEEYFEELVEKHLDEELNPDDVKVLRLLKKALVFFTIADACRLLPVEINDMGLVIRSYTGFSINTQIQSANDLKINKLMKESENKAIKYAEQIANHLNKNASATVLPTYYNSNTYQAPSAAFKRVDTADNTKIYNTF